MKAGSSCVKYDYSQVNKMDGSQFLSYVGLILSQRKITEHFFKFLIR